MKSIFVVAALFAIVGFTTASSFAQQPYSPAVGKNFPSNVYWGDTHVHTSNSPDAYSFGSTTLGPQDAYGFARGQQVKAHNGMKVRLRRPLDFLVVADHAEYLGVFARVEKGDPEILETEIGRRWHGYLQVGEHEKMMTEFVASITSPDDPGLPKSAQRVIWREVGRVADQFNDPGRFTAFIGYEWSSMVDGNNLHRVVIFKDKSEKTDLIAPFSAQDSADPEGLWKFLAAYEAGTGGEALAIAHNGNLSNGYMFANKTLAGTPLTRAYAETRARWEPLYEVTQVKGDGEAHPFLSPDDEFADYETWDEGNILRTAAKENWMLQHEYGRSALKLGLQAEAQLGANPFKFGMIGSTDSHTALATAAEDNFFGKFPDSEPSPDRLTIQMGHGRANALWPNWTLSASGYAAVWAQENTRASLFESMKRREVYATTGSRMVVRFFGGWDYAKGDIDRPDYVDVGYAKGVPMGGDLANAPKGKAPTFLVFAAKDPDGANLDRAQIVKGWLDADGSLEEKVYDVALSDGRKVSKRTGKAKPVGSTVDVKNASYTNEIGAPQLSAAWTDPDFDPQERAFYYVRVIEIPTPRWSAYDAKFFGLDVAKDVPMINQDRAYTSPIWYTP